MTSRNAHTNDNKKSFVQILLSKETLFFYKSKVFYRSTVTN